MSRKLQRPPAYMRSFRTEMGTSTHCAKTFAENFHNDAVYQYKGCGTV